ncbi:2-oxo acid dehydrogenase subunit E2 [Methanocella sp. CWC-04]|uniref:2-oxo acid dehydrogenase subunit E2 n=1 Tax=Methanooceanicella nereidis TaxID=2052831 RepID=A0AAP2RE99_9EURY|nr:dihydrolipoamide acetyltransferase family protein [Methanocella sp. CWC-04]MCD1295191.1 2-oxo acid dehydrogenase subunit E2 [Methanocella sp. CWC-04]
MAYEFKLPDLGEGISTGEIKKWHVKKGDPIEEDDTLVEVETDKAVVELPAPVSGTVQDIKFSEGDMVNVGSVIAVIGEKAPAEKEKAATEPEKEVKKEEKKPEEKKKPEAAPPSPPKAEAKMPVLATPATRMLAKELKVDLETVEGTGPGGRITDGDVKKAAGKAPEKPPEAAPTEKEKIPPPAPAITPAKAPEKPPEKAEAVPKAVPPEKEKPPFKPEVAEKEERTPLRGIRRTISEHMMKTFMNRAQVTLMDDADVTELYHIRNYVNSVIEGDVKVSYLAYTIKAVVAALRAYPMLNASIDDEKNEIVIKHYYNIGIAVETPRGLIVPVIKDADKKSMIEISKEIKELAETGRAGSIRVDQMKGGTFTIANIGSYGGLFSTPVINYPESAILEMQQIRDTPRVVNDEICIRKVMNLSLTIDHRIVDGADGQLFLNSIKRFLEDPQLLFVGMI